jgi:hypothetical protein
MTQSGPFRLMSASAEGRATTGITYVVCHLCVKRFKSADAEEQLDEPRCECGARLHAYIAPAELSAPARGVLPRLTRFWIAGREDGYWHEKRFFRPAAAERVGASPRQVRFAYEAGRRVGERLRECAHLHAMRVMKMKAASAAATSTARQHAAA